MSFLAAIAAAALVATPELGPSVAEHHLDLQVAPFTSTLERLSLCGGAHFARRFEGDLCLGGDRASSSVSAHVFYRWGWRLSPSAEVGVGPGVGVRTERFCPYAQCALSTGPELLASVQAVQWVSRSVGLTLQADGGLQLFWVSSRAGLVDRGYRFPARVLAGVAF